MIPSFGPVFLGSQATDQSVNPTWVSGVGTQAADLGEHQLGFRCVLGLLIPGHRPGAEGVGAQEAMAAVESSLNSC